MPKKPVLGISTQKETNNNNNNNQKWRQETSKGVVH